MITFLEGTLEEKQPGRAVVNVGGGPKIAVAVLSGLSVRELKTALIKSDVKRLASISGIGKKTAERMIVELRDKFSAGEALATLSGSEDQPIGDIRLRDAAMALISLGYKQDDARKMVKALKIEAATSVEDLIRTALAGR